MADNKKNKRNNRNNNQDDYNPKFRNMAPHFSYKYKVNIT